MQEQKFNIHTHTERCGHAQGLDEQYVQSAIHAGITLLGFSEHIPWIEVRRSDCRMFYEQKEEYLHSIRILQEKYRDQLDIKVGYEVEYLREHYGYIMELKQECDYMILGQHCKYINYEYDCYCDDTDVLEYVVQIEEALSKNFITYIAHPDYFMLGKRKFSKACMEAAHRIARASIHYDVPLEINLNGFHYGKKTYEFYENLDYYEERYAYPFREFWEIVSCYGCKVVYGFDAHSPIAFQEKNRITLANQILRDIPLNFMNTIDFK